MKNWATQKFADAIVKNPISREHQINTSQIKKVGCVPVVDQGQNFIAGYSDEEQKTIKHEVPHIIFGDHTRVFKYVDFPYIVGADGTKVLTPNTKFFNPKFLYFFFRNLNIQSRGYNRHFKILKEYSVIQPPLPEQQTIATILSKIQEAIENQDKIIKTTTELKVALMRKLFSEGLNSEPLKETEIGKIPKSWRVTRLKNLVSQKIVDGVHKTPKYLSVGIPFVTAKDIKENQLSFEGCKFISEEEHQKLSKRCNVEKDDILLTKVGTVGSVAINTAETDFSIFVQLALIKPQKNIILPKFLYYCLQSPAIQSEIIHNTAQSTMKFIGTQKIAELRIVYPEDLGKQKEMVDVFAALDAKIENAKKLTNAKTNLFKSMLNNLMSGKIRVNNIKL